MEDTEKVRLQKNMVVLKLEGINDRDAAEKARGKLIYIWADWISKDIRLSYLL